MKIYDFDGMFDEKLSKHMQKNRQKYTESEWEDIIPQLYKKFGDTEIKSVGTSPNKFYADMTDGEIVRCLRAHLKQNVPVSEFLRNAIEKRDITDMLIPLLDGTPAERDYAMNLIGADKRVIEKYMEILVETDDGELKNRCLELIEELADIAVSAAIENYNDGTEKEYMLEILSRAVLKDDAIFDILIKEFRSDPENITVNAGRLATYGDERALNCLLEKIDEEGINFLEFRELKYAIESLGGEYTKKRDFSDDPYYKLIKPND